MENNKFKNATIVKKKAFKKYIIGRRDLYITNNYKMYEKMNIICNFKVQKKFKVHKILFFK